MKNVLIRAAGRWIWPVAIALALVAGLQVMPVSAQTDPVDTQICPTVQPPSPAQIQQFQAQAAQRHTQFVQQLAQALNLPVPTVESALASVRNNPGANQPPPFTDPITVAAAQLGITSGQLKSAVQAADQTLPCSGPGQPNAIIVLDSQDFFDSVAQQLGQGFSGLQVKTAFSAAMPEPPDPQQIQAQKQAHIAALANALGVSVDALTAALQSVNDALGCPPPQIAGPAGPTGLPALPPGGGSAGAFMIAVSGSVSADAGQGPVIIGSGPAGSGAAPAPPPVGFGFVMTQPATGTPGPNVVVSCSAGLAVPAPAAP